MQDPVQPKLLLPGEFPPSPLLDIATIAALEAPDWEAKLAAIDGPLAASFLSQVAITELLSTGRGWPATSHLLLHTANPGPKGEEHIFGGTILTAPHREVKWGEGTAERHRSNLAAVEWAEVSEKAAVEFFSVFLQLEIPGPGQPIGFLGWGSLAAKVEFEKGDTLRFNVGALKIEIP